MAGNRYYIPRRRTGLDLARLGIQLYGIQQRGKQAGARQQLTEKEHALATRAQTERERVNRLEFGYEEPITLQGPESPITKRGWAGTEFVPGIQQKLLDEKIALRNLNERAARITDMPPKPIDIAKARLRLKNFDEAYGGNAKKVLGEFIDFAEQNPEMSSYQIFKQVDGRIKADSIRIGDELQKSMLPIRNIDDPKLPFLANMRKSVLDGTWIRQNMPNCADREIRERQEEQIEEDLAKAKLAQSQRGITLSPDEKLVTPKGVTLATGPVRTGVKGFKPGDTVVSPTGKKLFQLKEKPPTQKELMLLAKEVRDTESIILTNLKKEGVRGHIDFFNRYAKKPYVYKWTTKGRNRWVKVNLPKVKGKQATARDVWTTMQETGMTFKEVLDLIWAK